MTIKPLLKYAGAKNWCAPSFAPVFQALLEDTGGYWIEPFVGSASMHLATQAPRAVLGDVMEPLIEFYTVVKENPGELAWNLSALALMGVDKENYLRIRDMRPDTPLKRAARFFYLARLGFNGLIRHNRNGENNVPYGDAVYRKSVIGRSARDAIESLFPNKEKIHQVSEALARAELYCGDFAPLLENTSKGDLCYIDPPYSGTYSGYSKDGWDDADQERLAVAAVEAMERGAVIVGHNAWTDHVRYLYGEWCHGIQVREKRSIAANGSKRENAPCVVVVSRNAPEGFLEAVTSALGERVMPPSVTQLDETRPDPDLVF